MEILVMTIIIFASGWFGFYLGRRWEWMEWDGSFEAVQVPQDADCNWCKMAADTQNTSVTACPFHSK